MDSMISEAFSSLDGSVILPASETRPVPAYGRTPVPWPCGTYAEGAAPAAPTPGPSLCGHASSPRTTHAYPVQLGRALQGRVLGEGSSVSSSNGAEVSELREGTGYPNTRTSVCYHSCWDPLLPAKTPSPGAGRRSTRRPPPRCGRVSAPARTGVIAEGAKRAASPQRYLPEGKRTKASFSQNHRIIEWFGLEGTLKTTWFQPPCHEQGHLPPAQVAQSSIQPGLEPCQGGEFLPSVPSALLYTRYKVPKRQPRRRQRHAGHKPCAWPRHRQRSTEGQCPHRGSGHSACPDCHSGHSRFGVRWVQAHSCFGVWWVQARPVRLPLCDEERVTG